jgi:hypothetical protein
MGAIAATIAGHLINKGAKGILGLVQKNRANKMKFEGSEFDYIPKEMKDNRDLAEQGAYSNRSFNQSVDEANIRKAGAGGRYAASKAGTVAQRLAGNASTTNQVLNELARVRQTGRNERVGRVDRLMGTNAAIAQRKMENRQRFDDTKRALEGSAMQNVYGAISDFGASIALNRDIFSNTPPVEADKYKTGFEGFKDEEAIKYTGGLSPSLRGK